MDGFKSLLQSRKVLLAVLGVINTLVLSYLNIKPEVWASIDALLITVIASIAIEDHGANSATTLQPIAGETVNVTQPPADPAPKP